MLTLKSYYDQESGVHLLSIHDDESDKTRLVAKFWKEEILDFVVGAILNAPYRRREELWEACKP